MGMDRLGIEPGPSRMLSGCHATTPTGPEPRRRVLQYLLGTAFRAEALSRPARSASFLPFCCRRTVGARCGQTSAGLPVRPLFFLAAAAHSFWLVACECGLDSAREAKLLLAAPSGPIALLAEQAAGALLWFVLAAAKRVRPPSALDAKLFLLVAPWGPIAVYFLYSTPLVGARRGQTSAAWKSAENKQTSKQASKQASQQA